MKKRIALLVLFSIILIAAPVYAENSDLNTTFTDLDSAVNIDDITSVELTENYTFNPETDGKFSNGVEISKNMTITGKDTYIDGAGQARLMHIKSYCNVVIENITFKNGYSNTSGAGIYLDSYSNLTLVNCGFEANTVYNSNGGGINAGNNTNIEIRKCQFATNTAIRESDLEWNAFKKGMGSSIFVWIESNLRIYDSVFRQDNAYLANILLVSYSDDGVIRKPSNLTVKNCTFEKNTIFSNGVIYLDELGCGEIIDSAFIENNVSHCGSLILDACYQALVKNCLFTRNTGAHGAAIHVKVFNSNYRSNVTIEDCNFTKNTAEYNGGAVYSKYGIVNIKNCKFTENMAKNCGGAVFTKLSSIDIENSLFEKNTGTDGGAVFTKDGDMSIENSDFKYNQATGKGGAVYSRNRTLSYADCIFQSNTAPKGADIYGEYTAEITQTGKYYSDVNLEIRLSSKLNDYLSQKVKVKFTGPTTYTAKWFKTDKNGVLKLKVPKNLKVGKYTVKITLESGICYTKTMTVKVIKAPCKASVKKVKTTYKSGKKLKITLKNKKTGKKVTGAEITLKLSNGKKYSLKTDEKGTATFDTSKLKAGKYSVTISAKDKNIKLKKTRTSIEIKKAKAKISFTKKVKKSGKINITVLNKKSGKAIKNSFKVKVQNGKTYKTLKVKTNKKGVLKINTAGLKKGKHSIEIILKSKNYNIAEKIRVKII